MKPGVAKGIHWRPKQSISQQVRTENITYLPTDRYVLGHVTGLNGFYLSRFKTPFLNLPVLYIPCKNRTAATTKHWLDSLSKCQLEPAFNSVVVVSSVCNSGLIKLKSAKIRYIFFSNYSMRFIELNLKFRKSIRI